MPTPQTEHAIDAGSDEVLYDVADGIATLTLNRPARLNTISREMLHQFGQLMLKADADPAVRVVILTGSGRAFCAGLDMTSATQGKGIARKTTRTRRAPRSVSSPRRRSSCSTWTRRRSAR